MRELGWPTNFWCEIVAVLIKRLLGRISIAFPKEVV